MSGKNYKEALKVVALLSIIFAASSFLFSLLSKGRAPVGVPPNIVPYFLSGLIDWAGHAVMGALAALPTRNKFAIAGCAIFAVLIDVDHIGALVGLQTEPRASHSLAFGVIAFVVVFWLARKGMFGRQLKPLVVASMALASVGSHLAWDSIQGAGGFPLWLPFSSNIVFMTPFVGILVEIGAAALMWLVTMKRRLPVNNL